MTMAVLRALVSASIVLAPFGAVAQSTTRAGEAESRPIIAGVVAQPERYLGRRLQLYGVVVRVEMRGKHFYVQDVSQRPLLVVAPDGTRAKLLDEYVVIGALREIRGELAIVAERMTPAKVTAGGGCC